MIKSRNRVKTSQLGKKRESGDGHGLPGFQHHQQVVHVGGLAAAHPDVASAGLHAHGQHLPPPPGHDGLNAGHSLSRSNTPRPHDPNIAPQHIFDTVTLAPEFHSPSLNTTFRQPSPSSLSLNGTSQLETPQTHEALLQQNRDLRTRVSELEVINGLFRGRVGELENSEQEARRAEKIKDEEIARLRSELEEAGRRIAELRKRTAEGGEDDDGQDSRKRARLSNGDSVADHDEAEVNGAPESVMYPEPAPRSSNFMMP